MMAEAGPYGITQFDVAGVVGAYQQSQANRIQMMIAQKQMERIDKETKNEDAASKAVSAYYSPTPNASGAAPTTGAAPGTAPGAGPAMPNAAARQKLIGTLMAIDPATAEKYMNVMAGMDKDQATRAAQTNAQIMQVMGGLLQLPPEQRKAAIQQQAPQLQQLGYTPDQLAGFDPSDQNLRSQMAQHMDADKLLSFVKPEINAVGQGGSLQQTSPSGQTKTLYESPTMAGPNGEVFTRPGAASTMGTNLPHVTNKQEYDALPPGTQFLDPQGNHRQKGGQSVAPAGGFQ
jgi:hypothetical protein